MSKFQKAIIAFLSVVAFGTIGLDIWIVPRWQTPLGPPLQTYPTATPFGLPATWTPDANATATRLASSVFVPVTHVSPIPTITPNVGLCGAPPSMNILVVGSDSRGESYRYGLADSIRLVRVDFVNPRVTVLTLAVLTGSLAWQLLRRQQRSARTAAAPPPAEPAGEARELTWEDVQPVDLIGLEVGYRLIPMVDRSQGGTLPNRIKGVRKKLSQELGFLIPSVHFRDNLDLSPNAYRLTLHGVPVAEADVYPDRDLAINPGRVFGTLQGAPTKGPAFGLEAVWIDGAQRDHAQALGYTVVDASTVIATHISEVLQRHAASYLLNPVSQPSSLEPFMLLFIQ